MMTDFRALCAELLDEVVARPLILDRELIARARAALGEADEPVMPEGKKPTRDELWELWLRLNNELPDRPAAVAEFWEHAQINARARAALAAEPAVPEVVGTDTLRDKLIQKGWVTPFNADTLVRLIEEHYADESTMPLPLADTHYEWELEDAQGSWQAGGSSNSQSDVEREGMRYLQTYAQDGPHKLIIRQHTTQTINEITNG